MMEPDYAIKSLKAQLRKVKKVFCYVVRRSKAGHMYCAYWYYKDREMYNINWKLQAATNCLRSKKDGSIRITPCGMEEWLRANIVTGIIVRRID